MHKRQYFFCNLGLHTWGFMSRDEHDPRIIKRSNALPVFQKGAIANLSMKRTERLST